MLKGAAALVALLLTLLATAAPAHALPPTEHDHGVRDAAANVVLAQARARGVAELPPSPFLRRTSCGAVRDALRTRGTLQRRALVRLRHAQRSGSRVAAARSIRGVRGARAATRRARARANRVCFPRTRRASIGDDGERLVGTLRVERPRATVAGTGMVLALPIDFRDVPARRSQHAPERYEQLFFGDDYPHGGGSLDRYWRDMSYGAFSVDGSVADWRRMPRPRSAYAGGSGGMGAFPSNSQSLLEDAVRANDASVDFGRYDNDGPDGRPNSGDDDGIVDAIFLVYAGTGAVEEGGLDGIWPHAWRRAVETRDRAAGGGTISVDRYAALPERMATAGSDGDLLTVGIAAHEYGHVLGLPDLVGHGDDPGPGRWDLMGSGLWGFRDSSRPTGLSTWSRARLGWTLPQLLEGDHPGRAMPSSYAARSAVKLPVEGEPLHEHFLVERRTRTGFDADLPGDGLLVWHVDDSQPADGSGSHARVGLVAASGATGGVGDLLRPGGHLSDSSSPSTRAHDGGESLVAIQNVQESPGWSVDLHAGRASMAPAIDQEIEASGPQAAPPVVTLTTPASGAYLRGTVTMTCDATGSPNISRMSFMRGAGATTLASMNINPSAASVTRTYDWATTGVADGPDSLSCRARNTSNQWTESAFVPVTVDNTPPVVGAPGDGAAAPDVATQEDTTTLAAHWAAGTDATSGISGYQWRFCTTTACDAIVASGTATATATSASAGGLSLVVGSTYYACLSAIDVAGNVSASTCSDGVQVVAVPPAMGAVRDGAAAPDLQFQSSTADLAANWDPATGGTGGVASYDWRFCAAVDCVTIVASGSSTTTTAAASGLALADGTTWYACVRAVGGAGAASAYTCSDGVVVDASAPTSTAPDDGAALPDVDFQSSTTDLDANWAAASDGTGSGTATYDWRFCESAACATMIASGTTTGLTASATELALADGSTWYACTRAVDVVGNVGAWVCSDGVTVDVSPPVMGTPLDGMTATDIDYQASTTTLDATWPAANASSGIASYDWRFCDTTLCGTVLGSGSGTTLAAGVTGLTLTNGATAVACVRAVATTGTASAWSCSDGVAVDTSAPTMPIPDDGPVAPDDDGQSSTTQLDATWAASTDSGGSGVVDHDWRFCADTACATIVASGSGTATSATATGLTLTVGSTYYACVRGTDLVGNVGGWSCSDGITVLDGPSVSITSPASGADVRGTVTIGATATDPDGVTRVEYFVDGVLLHTDGPFTATTPYSSTWSMATKTIPIADGAHSIEVRAYEGGGAWGSATISVFVDNTAPGAATLAGITAGSTVSGAVSVTGSGTDSQGIVQADYSIAGPTIVHSTTTAPQASFSDTWSWDTTTVLDGNHTIRTKLRDAAGNAASSAIIRYIVHNNADVTAPSGAIDPSLDGATLTGAVSLLANVTDDNAIVKVEFLIDGTLVSTADTGMPAGYVSGQRAKTWTSSATANGSYVLSARITDAGGNVTTTAGVTVTVSN